MRTSTTRATGRKLISVAAVSAALVAAATTSVAVAQEPVAPGVTVDAAAQAVAAPAERLIVGYRTGAAEATSNQAADADAAAKGKEAGENLDFQRRLGTGAALVDLGEELSRTDVADVIAEYQADPQVAYVVPDRLNKPMADPNDTEYAKQWDLFESAAGMRVPGAWTTATGTGVTVAVIDTGYVTHSDVAANIVAGYDFIADTAVSVDGDGRDSNPADPGDWYAAGECEQTEGSSSSWHGTHVAGTIAAVANNNKGVAGIAYNAKISPVRALGKCGGYDSDIIDAITWASGGTVSGVPANTNVAKVINMSLGGGGACSSATQSAITGAVNRGTTVVVAAGNENANASTSNPANCNNVITVAATGRTGARASYSNYGSVVDISAPGGEMSTGTANGILSTLNSGAKTPSTESYAYYQGTSMATPHIAGLVALMKSANSSLTPAQIETAIKNNARALPGSCSGGCGAGLADATKTVQAVSGTGGTTGTVFSSSTAVSVPDNGSAVESSIAVTGRTGNAPSALQVGVDITHTYRGDLVITLVAPDGTTYPLKASSTSDSADNVNTTYTVDASSETANGTWKLRVQDVAASDTGKINSWKLTF
ncbi:S8 family serine peptidase [Streptomyces sp. SID12501]|uniref:S8 family serine peptidase n=1 Tax=Streptomyces sp. SID12501 TaxID=2706042 RepID=A0A6B3C0Q8_9ACTN|nr:S8 family serine peptidase [Streptomyces sp. SID12501]NEC90046.1 S8 family serine peptidase [Streptomyces sp. SID12501]